MINYKKEIYIIRHGETDFNNLGIIQGSGVDSDLNETGKKQAQAFYNKYKEIPFRKIYATALKRTHQTVYEFVRDGKPFEILPEFNEICWGEIEGKTPDAENINAYRGLLESWANGNTHRTVNGGETPEQLVEKQKIGLKKLLENKQESPVLLAMHGRALRILLTYLTDNPLKNMDNFPHQNTSLYKVIYDYNTDKFEITSFNNLEHLDEINLQYS